MSAIAFSSVDMSLGKSKVKFINCDACIYTVTVFASQPQLQPACRTILLLVLHLNDVKITVGPLDRPKIFLSVQQRGYSGFDAEDSIRRLLRPL
jgi:hypothetical protein